MLHSTAETHKKLPQTIEDLWICGGGRGYQRFVLGCSENTFETAMATGTSERPLPMDKNTPEHEVCGVGCVSNVEGTGGRVLRMLAEL